MVDSRNRDPRAKRIALENKRWMRSFHKQAKHPPPMLPYQVYSEFTYPKEYNTTLRNSIRNRDSYVCQVCNTPGTNKTLVIHHINYDKRDCREKNLVTLCILCHDSTSNNRRHWQDYFWKRIPHSIRT